MSSRRKKAITDIRTHIGYNAFDYEQFGRNLMNRLFVYYRNWKLEFE